MTETYFPFDSGAGANVQENQWSLMARHWLQTGVIRSELNGLQVYADSSGMQVKVKSGQAAMMGHFYQNDAELILPISAADPTYSRIDQVILRLDWGANTINLAVIQGSPSATPAVPALTQNTSIWEISLAQVSVAANVATIAAGNVTDERSYATALIDGPTAFPNLLSGNGYQKLPNGLIIQWGKATSIPNATLTNVALPISFPNAFLQAVSSVINATGPSGWNPTSLSQIGLIQSNGSPRDMSFIAIGW